MSVKVSNLRMRTITAATASALDDALQAFIATQTEERLVALLPSRDVEGNPIITIAYTR